MASGGITRGDSEELGPGLIDDFMSELDPLEPLPYFKYAAEHLLLNGTSLPRRPSETAPPVAAAAPPLHAPVPLSVQVLHELRALPLMRAASSAAPAAGSQPEGSQSGTQSTKDGKPRQQRGPRPRLFKKFTCQSDGCPEDLSALSFYYQRNHICPPHLKAASYLCRGVETRFCQRCGVGHPLTEFEGEKRSCRKALEKHNNRRRGAQASQCSNPALPAAAPPAGEVEQSQSLLGQQSVLPEPWAQQWGWGATAALASLPLPGPGGVAAPTVQVLGVGGSNASAGTELFPQINGEIASSLSAALQPGAEPQGLAPAAAPQPAGTRASPVAPAPAHGAAHKVQALLLPQEMLQQGAAAQQQQQQQQRPDQYVLLPREVLEQMLASLGAAGSNILAALM
eukprot:scaffold5.g921.t1